MVTGGQVRERRAGDGGRRGCLPHTRARNSSFTKPVDQDGNFTARCDAAGLVCNTKASDGSGRAS